LKRHFLEQGDIHDEMSRAGINWLNEHREVRDFFRLKGINVVRDVKDFNDINAPFSQNFLRLCRDIAQWGVILQQKLTRNIGILPVLCIRNIVKLGCASALIALRFHSKQSLRRKKKRINSFRYALGSH